MKILKPVNQILMTLLKDRKNRKIWVAQKGLLKEFLATSICKIQNQSILHFLLHVNFLSINVLVMKRNWKKCLKYHTLTLGCCEMDPSILEGYF